LAFFEKKGLPQKVLMRTSQQFRFFFGGGIFEEIFILMLVVSDVWIFSMMHFLRGQQFSQHRKFDGFFFMISRW